MTEDFVTSSPQYSQSWQQAILDSADFVIVSTDINGVIQTLNAGALKQFGYSPEEIIDRVTPIIFHDPVEVEQRAQVWSIRDQSMATGIQTFGLRQTRYIGLAKTHLQHVFSAVARNIRRLASRLNDEPITKIRVSRFAALAPT